MSKSELKKYITSMDEQELRSEILNLYQKFPEVKSYYAIELGTEADRKKIYDKAKKDIWNLFYISKRPRKRPRIQKIKTLLKEREKLSIFTHETIDLYLYAVETAVAYLLLRPRTTKATYNSSIENFRKAAQFIETAGLQDVFKERCVLMVSDAELIFMLEEAFDEIYRQCYKS